MSEITWLTNERRSELNDFWTREYPEIDTASNKIKILERNDYTLVGYFTLRQDSWSKNYYQPLQQSFEAFLEKHHYSEMAKAVVQENQKEIELYEKYKAFYSYGFYIAQKIK